LKTRCGQLWDELDLQGIRTKGFFQGFMTLVQSKTMGNQFFPGESVSIPKHHFKMRVIHIMRMICVSDKENILGRKVAVDI